MNSLDTSKLANEIAVILNKHLESHIHDANETERILMQLPIVKTLTIENINLKKNITENANNVTLEVKELQPIDEKNYIYLSNTNDINVNLMKKEEQDKEEEDKEKEDEDEEEEEKEDEEEEDEEEYEEDEVEEYEVDENAYENAAEKATAIGSFYITSENNEVITTDKCDEKYVEVTDNETEVEEDEEEANKEDAKEDKEEEDTEEEDEVDAEEKDKEEEDEEEEDEEEEDEEEEDEEEEDEEENAKEKDTEEDEVEDDEVEEIEINDRIYYKDGNGIIYNQDIDGDPGNAIGYYNQQGEPIFY